MEQIDPAMARRVWQRVKGEAPPAQVDASVQLMIEEAWEDAQLYRFLQRRHRGRRSALYLQLYRQTMEQLRLLKGICALTEQCDPVLKPVSGRRESEQILLRRCYSRALQRLRWYADHEANPRYGHILSRLIPQTQNHTRLLLQLMTGTSGK